MLRRFLYAPIMRLSRAMRRRLRRGLGLPALLSDPEYPHNGTMNPPRKLMVLCEAQGWRCCYCGCVMQVERPNDDDAPSVDEVLPRCFGGRREWTNQVAACRRCNTTRGFQAALVFWRKCQQTTNLMTG